MRKNSKAWQRPKRTSSLSEGHSSTDDHEPLPCVLPPHHHCRQVAAVSQQLDVGSLYKALLCSLLPKSPGPLSLSLTSNVVTGSGCRPIISFCHIKTPPKEALTASEMGTGSAHWSAYCCREMTAAAVTSQGVRTCAQTQLHMKTNAAFARALINSGSSVCDWAGSHHAPGAKSHGQLRPEPEIVLSFSVCLVAACLF